MKRFYMTIAAGLLALSQVSAQTTIATLGFESGDEKGKASQYSLTPGLSAFGDWVNKKDVDQWSETFADDVHSGEYAFQAVNGEVEAPQSWDRGFKIANLPIKEETSYRISFWVKGTAGSRLSSWLSKGIENLDRGLTTASGQNMGLDQVTLNGEWQHLSFVTFYGTADMLNTFVAEKESWRGGAVWPEAWGGDGVQTYFEHFEQKMPEEFFFIANCFSNNSTYLIDDIVIEEGVQFNQATFNNDIIRLDFGYSTNIADLAKAESDGVLKLDASTVKVTINGEAAPVEFLEGNQDGYLYAFLEPGFAANDGDVVVVTYTPGENNPILYKGDKRPSIDAETDLPVPGFTAEVAYFDADVDALPSSWAPAQMLSSTPENESFEIVSSELTSITITYDKEVSADYASASLIQNGVSTPVDPSKISVSEDGRSIITAVSGLADGDWEFVLSGVTNAFGVDCLTDQKVTFSVGPDTDPNGTSEVIYATDFDNELTEGVPEGWVTYNEAGFHLYGFNENGTQYTYNYGGNPGGGGTRLFDGFSGDFNKALYWGTRGTNEGYAEFGSQVKDWTLLDGSIDPEMPEGVALKLEARKYQISFLMAAWKGEPTFTFTLEDLDGNIYAQFKDVVAAPNMNGSKGAVTGSVKSLADFTVPKDGYYVLRFTAQEAQWLEFLLANVKLITMPSKASYYKGLLANAKDQAQAVLNGAEGTAYDGDTKTALANAITKAETAHFTQPSDVNALIDELSALSVALKNRVNNIDQYGEAILNAMTAQADLLGTKYEGTDLYKDASATLDQYLAINASALSDDELAAATPALVSAAGKLQNVKSATDVLTWRGYKAWQTAQTLGLTEDADVNAMLELVSDDDAKIAVANTAVTAALYDILATNGTMPADELKTTVNYESQKVVVDGVYVDKTADDVATSGIDLTSLIKNPKFYTFATDFGATIQTGTVPGWEVSLYEGGAPHLSGTAATAENPAVNSVVNAYGGGAEYQVFQTIENVPVGVYDVYFASRTAIKNQPDVEGIVGVFNDKNEDGLWDKYIFAQVNDGDSIIVPFSAGSSWSGHPTVIPGVKVDQEGAKLTIGFVEHLVSGNASGHDYSPTTAWDTNTFAGDARLYFVSGVAGYDYVKAKNDLLTGIEAAKAAAEAEVIGIYSVSGAPVNALQPGINIVKYSNGSVKKVLVK